MSQSNNQNQNNIELVKDALKSFLMEYFEFQASLKMCHFQTKFYGVHKATDEYLQKLADKVDKYFEVAQGKYGRIVLADGSNNITIRNMNEATFSEQVAKFRTSIHNIEKNITTSELISIKDEIKADFYQFIYLLTFK